MSSRGTESAYYFARARSEAQMVLSASHWIAKAVHRELSWRYIEKALDHHRLEARSGCAAGLQPMASALEAAYPILRPPAA